MNRRLYYIVGAALLVAFAAFSAGAFRESLTPYVSFEQARAMDRVVQVAGDPVHAETQYDREAQALRFTLIEPDSGDRIRVSYSGLKPANFDDAVSVVAIGTYNADGNTLEARQLLVKCPSKYQGIEETAPLQES